MSILPSKKPLKIKKSQLRIFINNIIKVKNNLIKLRIDDEIIINKTFKIILFSIFQLLKKKGNKFSIKIIPKNNWILWKDKKYILNINSLITEFLETSSLIFCKEIKIFKPFWNSRCKEISNKLLNNKEEKYIPSSNSIIVSENKKEDLRAKKIKLKPTPNQKKILKEWINTSRAVYNIGVDEINKDSENANFYKLRNKHVSSKNKGVKNNNVEEWMLNTPKDIRADTLKELVANFKGNITKLRNNTINFFNLTHRTKKNPIYSMPIPKSAIKLIDNEVKIYGRYIKDKIKLKEKKNIEINHDCKIEWKYPNVFYLIIPYKKEFKEVEKEKDIIALDPGVRKFMTSFSTSENKEFKSPIKIDKLNLEIDNIKSKEKINNKRRGILKRSFKIQNIVREFHYEVINYLTKTYKNILLPSFDSQDFFGNNRVIGKKSARKLNYLSHFKFKERLRYRCDLTNTNLYIVDESYTSKTCTMCGFLNNVGSNEIYNCKACNLVIDRDLNGARNIFIKNVV